MVATEAVVEVDAVVLCMAVSGTAATPCVAVVFAEVVTEAVVAVPDIAGETTWLLATNTVAEAIASAASADRIRSICILPAPLLPDQSRARHRSCASFQCERS